MRYTEDGTIFFKTREAAEGNITAWAVQLNHSCGGPGASFKTVKWASWNNEYMPFGLQETNEPPDMLGWEIATDADIVLYANNKIAANLETLRALVRMGYKGKHATPETKMAEIEWKMNA